MTLSELIVGYTNWTVDPSGVTGKGTAFTAKSYPHM